MSGRPGVEAEADGDAPGMQRAPPQAAVQAFRPDGAQRTPAAARPRPAAGRGAPAGGEASGGAGLAWLAYGPFSGARAAVDANLHLVGEGD